MTYKTLRFKRIELGLILALTIPACCLAQQHNPKTSKPLSADERILPLDPAVRTGRLANGFTYYIRHNETPKNRVIFNLANKVGSILETDDQQGLAHFM